LCRRALQLVQNHPDGFRRKNMPALLYRYFTGMAAVFANLYRHVRPGGSFAFVVGPNRTTLGGRQILVNTPQLLQDVAVHCGWRTCELVELDAYQRYGVHQRNSIRAEALVIVRRPKGH